MKTTNKPDELDGPLNPTKEELAALPMGATVYFDVIPCEVFWLPFVDFDAQLDRLKNLVALTWRAEPINRHAPKVLLPDERGEPVGAPVAVSSPQFAQWISARYLAIYGQNAAPDAVKTFVCGFDFQMRIGASGRAKR